MSLYYQITIILSVNCVKFNFVFVVVVVVVAAIVV